MSPKRRTQTAVVELSGSVKVALAKRSLLLEDANSMYDDLCSVSEMSPGFLKVNLDRCNRLIAKFDEVDELLIEANASILSEPDQISVKEERQIFVNLTNQILAKCYDAEACTESKPKTQPMTCNLKSIEVPHFAGNNFQEFWEVFSSLVDLNPSLTPTIKYHYLIGSLSEGVKSLISGFLPISGENYALAKTALISHFDNPRRIASAHVQTLLNLPSLSANSKPEELSSFVRTFKQKVAALEKMRIENLCSFILFQLCYSKLNKQTRVGFENQVQHSKKPCVLEDLLCYLQSRVQIADLESIVTINDPKPKSPEPNVKRNAQPKLLVSEKTFNYTCPLDGQNHGFINCDKFKAMSIDQRIQVIKTNNLCFLCFGKHRKSLCKSVKTCRNCQSAQHHGFLCNKTHVFPNPGNANPSTSATIADAEAKTLSSNASSKNSTLLSTAIVSVKNNLGQFVHIRCIVDSGSQVQIVTEKAVQLLGLSRNRDSTCVQGLGGRSSKVKGVVNMKIRSLHNPSFSVNASCYVLPQVCGKLPSSRLNYHVPNLPLADPSWNIPADVDLLLGAGIYSQILSSTEPSIKLYDNLIAQPSELGYLLLGQAPNSSLATTSLISVDDSLNDALERFWKIEESDTPVAFSPKEAKVEEFYSETTYRESDGRYVVRLPFDDDAVPLVENQRSPLLHFLRIEKQLEKDPNSLALYNQYFADLLSSGLMSPASKPAKYLLLHHAVRKDSSTTSIRPVFDASSPDRNGKSLNSQLLPGPALQSDLPHVLLRFRFHPIPLVADIKRMYNSVLIHPDDRIHQHVLWRPSPESDVAEFELNSVTFGISPSAYLAQKTIKQLVYDEGCDFPQASQILNDCVYVDDVVCCFADLPSAITARDQLISLTRRGGFELRKFCSTHDEVLRDVPAEHREIVKFSDGRPSLSVLGTLWSPDNDAFGYSVPKQIVSSPTCTKRTVLSSVARIFDCHGLLSPVTLALKIFLKTLWQAKLNWDEPVSSEFQEKWLSFIQELPLLTELQISRYIPVFTCDRLELVGFSDGSSYAYGAALYLRCVQGSSATLHLIKAKARATPTKPELTIPRTELQASKLLADLYRNLLPVLNQLPIRATHFFTDSSIVLCWLRTPVHKLQVFVSNRVNQISEATSIQDWHHVNSASNCADPASRSLFPKDLLKSDLWWNGPSFLRCEPIQWPPMPPMPNELPELRKENYTSLIADQSESSVKLSEEFVSRFSSLNRLIRVTCWVRRFSNKCRKIPTQSNNLSSPEMQEALRLIVKQLQVDYFPVMLAGKPCPKQFQSLTPFLDPDGILRVGGRLSNAPLPHSAKHPILIPGESHFSVLLCRDAHHQTLHGGGPLIRSYVQNKFWILGITRLAKRVKRECTRCARLSNKPIEPMMADLPKTRFEMNRPFVNVSADFAGPFNIHEGHRPRAKILKVYVCVFTCMATRATHLEISQDLSADSFISAVDRLTSRRGLCSLLYCDNGTNFVGANRLLKEVTQFLKIHGSEIEVSCAQRQINFQFCPPLSPWKNGITERVVGLFKFHLTRVVGNHTPTYPEFHTLIIRIEAVLNSRPLIPLTPDPADVVLTPAHFLIGDSLRSVPEANLTDLKLNTLSRWQLTRSMFQSFWRQWRNGYLQTLMTRAKWRSSVPNFDVGTIVLMKNENTPPLQWPLAIIEAVHPHKDGTVRVVRVRASSGSFLRPVNKLIPLHA